MVIVQLKQDDVEPGLRNPHYEVTAARNVTFAVRERMPLRMVISLLFLFQAINCLCPLRDVGYDQSNARGQNFVVTGGHGSLAPFMVQVLKAWGANVHCVTTRSQE